MGYQKITNLYRIPLDVFKGHGPFALMEKIHGTSAHITLRAPGDIGYFSGGTPYPVFRAIFDSAALEAAAEKHGLWNLRIHGESYGDKEQGMANVYGKVAKFIAFDVFDTNTSRFLDLRRSMEVVALLGLEFVDWVEVEDLSEDVLNRERDRPSVQAVRNGITDGPRKREGIVIRPMREVYLRIDGSVAEPNEEGAWRLCAKHKGDHMRETKTPRALNTQGGTGLSPERAAELASAQEMAEEYVTEERLRHVLDKTHPGGATVEMSDTPRVIRAMLEDIIIECGHEFVMAPEIGSAFSRRTPILLKKEIQRRYSLKK